jgi:hypothetical protein
MLLGIACARRIPRPVRLVVHPKHVPTSSCTAQHGNTCALRYSMRHTVPTCSELLMSPRFYLIRNSSKPSLRLSPPLAASRNYILFISLFPYYFTYLLILSLFLLPWTDKHQIGTLPSPLPILPTLYSLPSKPYFPLLDSTFTHLSPLPYKVSVYLLIPVTAPTHSYI